jgi:hypothetical protein
VPRQPLPPTIWPMKSRRVGGAPQTACIRDCPSPHKPGGQRCETGARGICPYTTRIACPVPSWFSMRKSSFPLVVEGPRGHRDNLAIITMASLPYKINPQCHLFAGLWVASYFCTWTSMTRPLAINSVRCFASVFCEDPISPSVALGLSSPGYSGGLIATDVTEEKAATSFRELFSPTKATAPVLRTWNLVRGLELTGAFSLPISTRPSASPGEPISRSARPPTRNTVGSAMSLPRHRREKRWAFTHAGGPTA